ncbi:MAG: vitamin B12-dependent ribonucleotide reductase, partial [Thermoguttaceae bacterium]|jgi:ribonucleoside-diphosphate reductase alpha chain
LQYGVPLEVYVNKFSHTRFEPMGFTKNPDIRIAKSIVDYIFRWLGIQFLPGYREANKSLPPGPDEAPHVEHGDTEQEHKPAATTAGGPNVGQGTAKNQSHASSNGSSAGMRGKSNGQNSSGGNGSARRDGAAQSKKTASQPSPLIIMTEPAANPSARDEQFASFQTDAPTCDNCGAITVRNGNCYLCHNCGNSMGCS